MRALIPAGVLLVAAGCAPAEAPFVSSDIRLDVPGDTARVDVSDVHLCGAGDELAAVWTDVSDGVPAVRLQQSLDLGGSWLAEPGVPDEGIGAATAPAVGCQPGSQIVVWEDTRDGELEVPNIYARGTMGVGAAWLAQPTRLGDDEWGWFESHRPAVATAGRNVYVAWQDARYGTYDILFAASADWGASFAPAVRLDWDEEGSAWSGSPTIAADASGRVYVAWEDRRNGATDIYVTTSLDGGVTWSDDLRVDTGDERGAGTSLAPQLATDGWNVWLVWVDDRNGETDILMNWSGDQGATWLDAAVQVDADAPGLSASLAPRIIAAGGYAHVVWQDFRLSAWDIRYRRLAGATPYTVDVQLDRYEGESAHSLDPRIAIDGSTLAVAWIDERAALDGQGGDVRYAWSLDTGDTWPDADLAVTSRALGSAHVSDVSVHVSGTRLAAAWADDRDGAAGVYTTTLALGTEADLPAGEER